MALNTFLTPKNNEFKSDLLMTRYMSEKEVLPDELRMLMDVDIIRDLALRTMHINPDMPYDLASLTARQVYLGEPITGIELPIITDDEEEIVFEEGNLEEDIIEEPKEEIIEEPEEEINDLINDVSDMGELIEDSNGMDELINDIPNNDELANMDELINDAPNNDELIEDSNGIDDLIEDSSSIDELIEEPKGINELIDSSSGMDELIDDSSDKVNDDGLKEEIDLPGINDELPIIDEIGMDELIDDIDSNFEIEKMDILSDLPEENNEELDLFNNDISDNALDALKDTLEVQNQPTMEDLEEKLEKSFKDIEDGKVYTFDDAYNKSKEILEG